MITEAFKSVDKSTFAANGDRIDKVANYYTVFIYIIGAIFLSLSPFVAGPFTCTPPAEWKGNWMEYSKQYCYLMNSYYVPFAKESIQEQIEDGDAFEVTYYQWIPYYLLISGLVFMIPYVYWTSITQMAGIDLEYLITQASKFDVSLTKEKRAEKVKNLADYIDLYLDNQEAVPGEKSFTEKVTESFKCCSNQNGTLMGNNYFFCKLMYLFIISFQLFSLCKFLGMNLLVYAFDPDIISSSLLQHSFNWREKELFPLVTFCNFTKQITAGHDESTFIQCAMPNNIYNERFFVLLCFWLVGLLASMLYSTLDWFNAIFLSFGREKYVRHLIGAVDVNKAKAMDRDRLKDFVGWYLQSDGIFVFRMIMKNTSPVVSSEILNRLWDHFNDNYEEERRHRRQKGKKGGVLKVRNDSDGGKHGGSEFA